MSSAYIIYIRQILCNFCCLTRSFWRLLPCSSKALIIIIIIIISSLCASCGLLAQCWKIRVEHVGGDEFVCIASAQDSSLCLILRFLLAVRTLRLSDLCGEIVDGGLTLGWMQIIATVPRKVVHWIRLTSLPCHFEQPCCDIGYKPLVNIWILAWYTFPNQACKDHAAADQLGWCDTDEIVYSHSIKKHCALSFQVRVLVRFRFGLKRLLLDGKCDPWFCIYFYDHYKPVALVKHIPDTNWLLDWILIQSQ